jgi:nicotinate phosphoribosyltransferase
MPELSLSKEEEKFIRKKCYYFDPVFIDFLKGYRYNPEEVTVLQKNGELSVEIEGYWYRTVLWEVPLMAIISELFFKFSGHKPIEVKSRAAEKGTKLAHMGAKFSEFGTRRRFSYDVQETVLGTLIESAGKNFTGTSNLYMAMKYNVYPIGTHPHEWFMYHAAHFGYRMANHKALQAWSQVYQGSLGIALTDTYTTDNFFDSFELKQAKLFDGLRWDSGDPIEFTKKALKYYTDKRIDSRTKTIVYSDSLNLDTVQKIKTFTQGKIKDVYGIGTFLSNDVGATPLNMVIKMTHASINKASGFHPTVKLSDVKGKHTGESGEIKLCKKVLNLK